MFVWLMVILKIPIAMLLTLVWWATREPKPREEEPARVKLDPEPVTGPTRHHAGRRPPRWPRPGRRGPHGAPIPRPPARVRAYARQTNRARPLR